MAIVIRPAARGLALPALLDERSGGHDGYGRQHLGVRTAGMPQKSRFRRITLSQWILISMVVGIALGVAFPESARDAHGGWAAADLNVLSSIFLRMIKSLIAPLIFATLVIGIAGHGDDMKRVGRLAFRRSSTSRS